MNTKTYMTRGLMLSLTVSDFRRSRLAWYLVVWGV